MTITKAQYAALVEARDRLAESDGLDGERLARALNATVGTNGWLRSTPSDPVEEWRVNARLIAAEYDRLAEAER
jgi:hypothetical protein